MSSTEAIDQSESSLDEAGKRLLDMTQELDINLLDNVVDTMHAGDSDQQKVAQSVLTRLKENPEAWTKVDAILQYSKNQETKYFALQILENLIKTRWNALPGAQTAAIKTFIIDLIIKTSSDPVTVEREKFYLTKLNMVLVQILKREWPKRWPTFISDIVGASKSNEVLCLNNLNILKLFSTEVLDFSSGQLTKAKTKYLKETLCHEFSRIFQLCNFVLDTSADENLVLRALETLLAFMGWVPISYVFDTPLISTLTMKFLPNPKYKEVTLQCLSEIASIKNTGPATQIEMIEITDSQLITCDWILLADSMLKEFCEFILDPRIDENKPLIEPEVNLGSNLSCKGLALSTTKQLVLVRSCLADVLYSLLCLGLWCSKKTIQLYLTEFSRLLQTDSPIGDLIAAAETMLNSFYGRLDQLIAQLRRKEKDVLQGSSPQLRALLDSIKEFKPKVGAPVCIVHVRRRVIAKVIALWLDKISSSHEEYSFIKPNYMVASSRKHRNRMAVDNFDLHHEASVREFRFGNCNILVTSAISERCIDMPRCNLVISFDLPARFSDFIQTKGNCRHDSSKYIILLNEFLEENTKSRLINYVNMERLLDHVSKGLAPELDEGAEMKALEAKYEPYPSKDSKNHATIARSVSIINKYCSKLPSDSFTKLSPEWCFKEVVDESGVSFCCEIRLPINSPVRQTIIGPKAVSKTIAKRLAAYTACKVLHKTGELDDNMTPITKESMKTIHPFGEPKDPIKPRQKGSARGQSIGSTKHRHYYKKRIAEVFSGPLIAEGIICYLYKFKMVLTCPIPDEQNRRGRRIIDPSETTRNYAIVCSTVLPKICSFPVFTRSGEVLISIELVESGFALSSSQVKDLRTFHEFTFSKVLRLEKYPTVYDPDNSPFTVLLAPVIDKPTGTSIDWVFVDKIVNSDQESHVPTIEERKDFIFNHEDYVDAVVIPWYRLTDRQQFAYYVAEICTDLSPESPFPDEGSGFKTFMEYYQTKYNIKIHNNSQPVLDVDHTSARLNLLTPRYVNRKGRTLPSSTAKTRRESRESLVQKQLLIPELCSIHPFPASFWRKAVCLPCIFYRLNSLFLAEELRRKVAQDTKVGFVEPPESFEWPPLDFGWSLQDVINNQSNNDDSLRHSMKDNVKSSKKTDKKPKKVKLPKEEPIREADTEDQADFVIDYFDASKYDIPDIPLDEPPKDWASIKLISSSTVPSSSNGPSGWDQPLEQHDLFLEHSNEISWSDCEMEFDGEISERIGNIRCGSPSTFEPGMNATCKDTHAKIPPDPRYELAGKGTKFISQSESSPDDHKLKLINLNVSGQESDTISWSISDEDEDNVETGNSEDELCCYGEWKDSKSKNRSLLRELFLPALTKVVVKDVADTNTQFEALQNQLRSNEVNIGVDDLPTGPLDNLKMRTISDEAEQGLVRVLNDNFKEQLVVCDEDIQNSTRTWYKLLKDLSSRVDSTLAENSDLFKDNGVELVTVDDSFADCNLKIQPTFGELLPNRDADCNWPSEEWKNIKFDPTIREIKSDGPGPSVILQALTMSNASDGINLERFETVGDSFLKYSITAYLYCMYPSMHEGKLSYLRSTEISNANLYKLGESKNLGELMSATKFEPNDNWLAPGYSVAESAQEGDDESNKKREIDKALAEVPYDLLLQHSIPDKSIADCVEALIGAYLTASGSRAALLFMQWLGLEVVPDSFNLEEDLNQHGEEDKIWCWLKTPPSPLICKPPSYDQLALIDSQPHMDPDELKRNAAEGLNRLYYSNNLARFEKDIQYTFNDKAYLVQAFTHNSFHENHVTDCHQRLEFLGDALLDYLITRYLFEDPRCHSPGTLTDLRSALVNNNFFASLAVKYEFHEYLMYISDELFHVIDGFVKKFRFDSKDTITKGYTLLISEGESEYAEDIEVPKALGDVFESVAGAIYLDSGMSLDQVWQVYFKMMKPEIEYFSSNVPKSPIRELLESMPQNVRFSPSELAPDRKHRVIAEVFGLGRFTGVGRNKHSAKSTAAKRALRMLSLRRKELEDEKKEKVDKGNQ